MSKGPAAVPGVWVDQATLDRWGLDCVQALVSCGINPAGFGSYKATADRIKNARTKMDAWRAAKREKDPAKKAEMMRAAGGPPTAEENQLSRAKVQSGHLMQHSPCTTSAAANRFDRCQNVIAGVSQHGVPAVAMNKEEHDAVGAKEDEQAAAAQAKSGLKDKDPRGADYTPEQRHADQKERSATFVKASVDSKERKLSQEYATRAQTEYDAAQKAAGQSGASGGAGGAAGKTVSKPNVSPTAADMKTAADCITADTERQEKAMTDDCKNNAKANGEKAASPEHKAEVEKRAAEARAARDEFLAKQKKYGETLESPTATSKEKSDARKEMEDAKGKMNDAKDGYYDAASLGCYAQQGEALNNGTANSDGRIPGGKYDPAIGTVSPQPGPAPDFRPTVTAPPTAGEDV